MGKIYATILILSFLALSSCKTRESISGYYNHDTECLGSGYDGRQTLRAWGTGKDVRAAREEAYLKALDDVIFRGIRSGNKGCQLAPLVAEANARETFAPYFDRFFSRKGIYRDFVNLAAGKEFEKNSASDFKQAFAYIIEVDLPALRNKLKNDGIIQ